MIEISGITKNFGTLNALKGVSFTAKKGQVLGFLGANGAGKTTTMDIICGCLGADQGQVNICGYDMLAFPKEAKAKIGYLPDEPPLHLDMTVSGFLRYVAKIRLVPKKDLAARVCSVMERLSLMEVQHRLVGNLSKGYKQRVGLAAAMVHDPEVLVLDEPTEGLDPSQIAQIRSLIRELSEDHTIVLSSHILSEVESTCDEIVILNKGSIVASGSFSELQKLTRPGELFKLQVACRAEELAQVLCSLKGIEASLLPCEEEKTGSSSLHLKIEKDLGNLDEVISIVVKEGYGLRALVPLGSSLEEVFMELTSDHKNREVPS